MPALAPNQYDRFAGDYTVHADTSPYNAYYERPALQALLPTDLAGMVILDAACAAGGHAQHLVQAGARVVGIDASRQLLDEFGRRTGESEAYLADLSEPLSFLGDARFDIVLSSLTMHYIETWDLTLREFYRTMKDGGTLLLSTHHPSWLPVDRYFEKRIVRDVWKMNGSDVPVAFWHRSLQDIVGAILTAGFVIDILAEPQLPAEALAADEQHLAARPAFLLVKAAKRHT